MNNNQEAGKLYDALQYCNMYFNENSIEDFGCEEGHFKFYEEVNFKIPNCLYPFFCNSIDKISNKSPMTIFLERKMDVEAVTLKGFLVELKQQDFFDLIHISFLGENYKTDKSFIHSKLKNRLKKIESKNEIDLLYEVQFLLNSYEYVLEVLLSTLKDLFKIIGTLHSKYRKLMNGVFDVFQNIQNKMEMAEYWNLKVADMDNAHVCISIMNRFSIQYLPEFAPHEPRFVIGVDYHVWFKNQKQSDFGTIRTFLTVCGKDYSIEILEELRKKREVSIPQLITNLHSSNSTVARHIDELLKNNIIKVSRHEAKRIYYKMNVNFIKAIKESFNEYMDKFDSIEKH